MDVVNCAPEPVTSESEHEQLGSVTHSQDSEGISGLQIRSSARVSKKMRLDLITLPNQPHATSSEKKLFDRDDTDESKTPETSEKPRRRNWELWSSDDKDTFFEALNEYGKDFDAIQNYFSIKGRKKAVADHLIKNKDQIRHFYYRTWHKVSKHLQFSDDVKKATQELYALVNYGELRKKLGCVTEKTSVKLNELIHRGFTQVRSKGKTLRVKTPLCRTLRKINQLDECHEVLKLPARVNLELRPRSNAAWARVQATAHNPRVRTLVPLQKRLSVILGFFTNTWRPTQLKLRDRLSCSFPTESGTSESLLHVAPLPGATICLPTININEYLTSNNLSLNSFEERSGQSKPCKVKPSPMQGTEEEFCIFPPENSEEKIKKVRAGWTLADSYSVTIGELYLMFGSDSSLQLEYWWDSPDAPPLSSMLTTLLTTAKLSVRKAKVHCPCGHICGGAPTPRTTPVQRSIRANCEPSSAVAATSPAVIAPDSALFARPTTTDAFKAQLDTFRPRYCNRRGRTHRSKNVVVQRMLPLLPKTTLNSKLLLPALVQVQGVAGPSTQLVSLPSLDVPVTSPPSISNLLDLAGVEHSLLPSATNFSGLLNNEDGMQTPPTSPSRILKETDNQWLNSEVADFSLSSFLGHLDSPLKQDGSTRLSDVDSQLQCLETENSVDFLAKFADLAAQIVSSDADK